MRLRCITQGFRDVIVNSIESSSFSDNADARRQYDAARRTAAVFDLCDRTQIEIGGRDRAKFLHSFCTNDIKGLAAGRGCEAFVTSVQGKIVGHVSVYAAAESLWLTSVPGCGPKLLAHLSKYHISEDVTFADRTGEVGLLLVAGPAAEQMAAEVLPAAAGLQSPAIVETEFEATQVQIRRHDLLRLPCLYLAAPTALLDRLRDRLLEKGAVLAGAAVFDALRIEAGFPLYGLDLSDANLAQEAGRTKQAISFTKGCYLGQEPIARIDAMGHVNQELRGLRLQCGSPPPPGTEVWSTGAGAKKVGQITSSALSYADDRPVALALVRRGFETPGQALEARIGETAVPAVVYWPDVG